MKNIFNLNEYGWSELYLFLILFLSSGFVTLRGLVPSFITVLLWIYVVVSLLIRSKQNKNQIAVSLFSILTIVLYVSCMFNGEDLITTSKVVFALFAGFCFSQSYSIKTFVSSYLKVMRALCIISLVLFATYIAMPSLFLMLPIEQGHYAYTGIFTVALGYYRNFGMFWEPGAYQTFITIALLFSLTGKDIKNSDLFLFSLTILTTFSTTGFIVMIILFTVLQCQKRLKINKYAMLTFIAGAVVYFFYNPDFLFGDSGSAVFGKLFSFYESKGYQEANAVTSSTGVRYYGIIMAFRAFCENPFLGMGYSQLQEYTADFTEGMNTCTFINLFAVYGIIYGVIVISGFWRFMKYIMPKLHLLFFLILFVTTLAENFVNNPSILLLAYYGLSGNINYKNYEFDIE